MARRRRGSLRIYRDLAGRWRYTHIAGNGRIDDSPEQGFSTRRYAVARGRLRWPRARVAR